MTSGNEGSSSSIAAAPMEADASTPNPNPDRPNRKRRLSKRERKNMKNSKSAKAAKVTRSSSANISAAGGGGGGSYPDQDAPKYRTTHVPVPLPPDDVQDEVQGSSSLGANARRVGKWFPTAVSVKCETVHNSLTQKKKKKSEGSDVGGRTSSLVLFYKYVKPTLRQDQVRQLMIYLAEVARKRNLGGRMRVAAEGLNCTVSSLDDDPGSQGGGLAARTAATNLRHFALDLQHFSRAFRGTDFKYIDSLPPDRHFKELKILPVKELVYYGIKEQDAPLGESGVHLEAEEYHKMLCREDAVVIDVRNHYEALIGRFDGQMQAGAGGEAKRDGAGADGFADGGAGEEGRGAAPSGGGATYLDPMMRKSTDFTGWLAKPETREKLASKQVLMFCTGGVRCERASAYLKKQMGDEVKGVYQLQGGVEGYMKAFPEGGYWRGKNFVFDKREAVGVGNAKGDGGVVVRRGPKGGDGDGGGPTSAAVTSRCCRCSAPWDRYIGRRKCYTCGVPVLMCDSCMSSKGEGRGGDLDARCDLCIEEGVTVPASEANWTENGVGNRVDRPGPRGRGRSGGVGGEGQPAGKAARSVLKWGGGHAVEKKKARKLSRIPCRFGTECSREDCVFMHPGKNQPT